VMILLVHKFKVVQPYHTCIVQFVNLTVQSYMYSWLAIQSSYALWPCAVMHWTWNRVNPVVLGSIYTQQPGLVHGPQWKINGEGLMGIVVGLPIAFTVALLL